MSKIIPLWLLCCMTALSSSGEIIFSTALVSLANDFGLSTAQAQFSSAFYYLGLTLGIVLSGRFSDLYGRRNIVLLGLSLYCISILSLLALQNFRLLTLFRFLQGLGISCCSIIAQAIARDCYQKQELSKVYSIISIITCLLPSIFGLLGGFIVEYFSWKANVICLASFGLGLLLLCILHLVETSSLASRKAAEQTNFGKIFIKIFSDRKVIFYALMAGLSIGTLAGSLIEFPIFFINHLQIDPSAYGMLNIYLTISMLFGVFFNMRLIAIKYNEQTIIYYATRISFVGCLLLILSSILLKYPGSINANLIALVMFARMVHGIGHIMMMPHILSIALRNYQYVVGSASAIFNGIYYVVVTIVIFLTSCVHSKNSFLRFAILLGVCTLSNCLLHNKIRDKA